jgi:hypothetical protein
LEQALALHILLRRRGVKTRVRLGVQPYGFSAHAWVELDGVALGEGDNTMDHIVPFPQALV